jgi:hypothetical protein
MRNAASVTTALMAAFALFVIYTRLRNWLESNVPLLFYIALIAYMKAVDGSVPLWLSLAGLGCALLLRFEFINELFIKVVKFIEMAILAAIIYLCVNMVWQF